MIPASLSHSFCSLQHTVRHALKKPLTACLIAAAVLTGCGTTNTLKGKDTPPFSAQQNITQLNQYKVKLAQRIQEQNGALFASGNPQSMLRAVVVMAFKIDQQGQLTSWSVYRTNGDTQAEQLALSSLQRAAPLPLPPKSLFGGAHEIEIIEGWLFNNDGKFQIRTLASPQR